MPLDPPAAGAVDPAALWWAGPIRLRGADAAPAPPFHAVIHAAAAAVDVRLFCAGRAWAGAAAEPALAPPGPPARAPAALAPAAAAAGGRLARVRAALAEVREGGWEAGGRVGVRAAAGGDVAEVVFADVVGAGRGGGVRLARGGVSVVYAVVRVAECAGPAGFLRCVTAAIAGGRRRVEALRRERREAERECSALDAAAAVVGAGGAGARGGREAWERCAPAVCDAVNAYKAGLRGGGGRR